MKIVTFLILAFLYCSGTVSAQNFMLQDSTQKPLPEVIQQKNRKFNLLPHQNLDYTEKYYMYAGLPEDNVYIFSALNKEILINKEDSLNDDSELLAERSAKLFFPDSPGTVSMVYFDKFRYPLGNTIHHTYMVSKGRVRKITEKITDGIASRYFNKEMNNRLDSFKLQDNQFLQFDTAAATITMYSIIHMNNFKLSHEEMPPEKKEIFRLIYELLHEEVYKYKKLVIAYIDQAGIKERIGFIFEPEKSDLAHRYEELKAKYLKIFHNAETNQGQ